MTALQVIIKEAKAIRKKSPKIEWKKAVAQASAIYASKHKGKSPVGKKKIVKKAAKKKPNEKQVLKSIKHAETVQKRHMSGFSVKKVVRTTKGLKNDIKRRVNKTIQRTKNLFNIVTKNDMILKRIKEATSDLVTYQNYIDSYKNLSTQDKKNKKAQYKHIASLIKETKIHIRQLKKSI